MNFGIVIIVPEFQSRLLELAVVLSIKGEEPASGIADHGFVNKS